MKLYVDNQVYGFIILLYSQQLLTQLYFSDKDSEWVKIEPVIKELHDALSEKNKWEGYQRAIEYNGPDPLMFKSIDDLWYIMYAITNYRVAEIEMHDSITKEHHILLFQVIQNVLKKSHKVYGRFNSRFV